MLHLQWRRHIYVRACVDKPRCVMCVCMDLCVSYNHIYFIIN